MAHQKARQLSATLKGEKAKEVVDQLEAGEIAPDEVIPLLDNIGKKDRDTILEIALKKTTVHSGPLPSAQELAKYNEAAPDAAHRIIVMAEANNQATIDENKRAQAYLFKDRIIGYFIGFLGLSSLIAAAVYCVSIDKDVMAGIFLGTAALGVVAKFIPERMGNGQNNDD